MAEKLLELGEGLWIYKVHVDELKEQDINARSMPKEMFDRLSNTVGRDHRLEQLPFCAETSEGKLEIVSGHHRVRSARASEVMEIHALVDVTGLSESQIKAKQLAHNSIAGEDNAQLLQKIYEGIDSVDDRLEAYIDPEKLNMEVQTVSIDSVDLGLDFRTTLVVFMPYEKAMFESACSALEEQIGSDVEQVYLADLEKFQEFKTLMKAAGEEYDVRAVGTVMSLMSQIVLGHLGYEVDDPGEEEERVHLRELVGQAYIPKEAAEVIERAIELIAKQEKLGKKNRWQALEYLAADYAGGRR